MCACFTFQFLKADGGIAYTRRAGRLVRFNGYCSRGFPQFIKCDELEGTHLGILNDEDSIHTASSTSSRRSHRRRRRVL
jgi:hypothetical protein